MKRKQKDEEDQHQSKEFATQRAMNEKKEKNTQYDISHTERNVPGYNWELYKNIVSKSYPVKADTPGEENVKKQSVCYRQRSKKKDAKPQFNEENLRSDAHKEKQCQSKQSATERTMYEKNKKNIQRVIPHTERNVSGRNWELYKNIVSNPCSVEADTPGKENVKKKCLRYHQRPKKIHTLIPNPDAKPQLNEEQDNDNSKRKKLTKHVAMDCEMVGIGDGTQSMIARVSIVNAHGDCIYDKYVKPREPVQDYRTKVSGIRPHNLENGEDFQIVQKEVAEILRGRVLIGHALKYDLDVLYLSHPRKHSRDTSRFKTFRSLSRGNTPSLKKLAYELLGREIQTGEHSSVEDAKAAMQLYELYKSMWESEFYSKR